MFAAMGKFFHMLLPAPRSREDYFQVGQWLIYKKMVPLIFALLLILAAIAWWLAGYYLSKQAIPCFYYAEEALKPYSGEAILVDEGEKSIYRGEIVKGLRSGQGTHLNPANGAVVYQGGFLNDQYSGQGKLFQRETVLYEGGFLNGLYEGNGTLYNSDGNAAYVGQFAKGVFEGNGVSYNKDGKPLYEGAFHNGLYHGEGVLYDGQGNLIYTGGFARGRFEGEGATYTADGLPVYAGEFRGGLYDGKGTLYAPDGMRLQFEGMFVKGIPAQFGSIYNNRGQLLYTGNMFHGAVDYMGLLKLPISKLQEQVHELPDIYYGNGYVGYLYRELGFAVITQYDFTAMQDIEIQATDQEQSDFSAPEPPKNDTELFAKPEDNLVVNVLLAEGRRIEGQFSPESRLEVEVTKITGFEAFMESRVASIQDPTALLKSEGNAIRRGDHLFEVTELPDEVPFDGEGFYWDTIYYFYRKGFGDKGGLPQVVLCSQSKLGG